MNELREHVEERRRRVAEMNSLRLRIFGKPWAARAALLCLVTAALLASLLLQQLGWIGR